MSMQTRRILHYHLPPRGFWAWWCGGMAVYDALVVAAWIAINILYTQQRVALILPLFKGERQSSTWRWPGACPTPAPHGKN